MKPMQGRWIRADFLNHEPTEKDLARVRKYKKARAILEGSV